MLAARWLPKFQHMKTYDDLDAGLVGVVQAASLGHQRRGGIVAAKTGR